MTTAPKWPSFPCVVCGRPVNRPVKTFAKDEDGHKVVVGSDCLKKVEEAGKEGFELNDGSKVFPCERSETKPPSSPTAAAGWRTAIESLGVEAPSSTSIVYDPSRPQEELVRLVEDLCDEDDEGEEE